jgi:hypothetical protein
MKTYWLKRDPLAKALKIVPLKGKSELLFRSGVMTGWDGEDLFASAKTGIDDLDILFPIDVFSKLLALTKKDRFKIGVSDKSIFFKLRNGDLTEIYYNPMTEGFPEINLWDPEIDWWSSPANLMAGLYLALRSASGANPMAIGDNDLDEIYVSGNHVYAWADPIFFRSRLDHPVPFDISLPASKLKTILPILIDLHLKRIALYDLEDLDENYKGLALDFGQIRILLTGGRPAEDDDVPLSEDDLKSLGPELAHAYRMARLRQFVYVQRVQDTWERRIRIINLLASNPSPFLVKLTPEFKEKIGFFSNVAAKARRNPKIYIPKEDLLIRLTQLPEGKAVIEIRLEFYDKDSPAKESDIDDRWETIIYGKLNSVSFSVNSECFYGAVKGEGLMGFTNEPEPETPSDGICYFKYQDHEYFLRARKINATTEE